MGAPCRYNKIHENFSSLALTVWRMKPMTDGRMVYSAIGFRLTFQYGILKNIDNLNFLSLFFLKKYRNIEKGTKISDQKFKNYAVNNIAEKVQEIINKVFESTDELSSISEMSAAYRRAERLRQKQSKGLLTQTLTVHHDAAKNVQNVHTVSLLPGRRVHKYASDSGSRRRHRERPIDERTSGRNNRRSHSK
ncbi:hypothetical protein EVAR_73643_1, partial [Eumeta japonica]